LEPKGVGRPNPMVGFPRLQAREEVDLIAAWLSNWRCET
jgi:hypothetical protein